MENNNEFTASFLRKAKLAESHLLVAALRRDAGEISDAELSVAACQYAAAVTNWRLARQTQIESATGLN